MHRPRFSLTRRFPRTIRRRSPVYYFLLSTIFLFFLRKFSPSLSLLTYTPAHSLRTSTLLPTWQNSAHSTELTRREEELIPRIIHQTWKNTTIPEKWTWSQERTRNMTCLRNEGWIYMFWTDDSALSFIQQNYPAYLDLYQGYKYPIQRADALRYFLMFHFGGVYLDMDIAPRRKLDLLLTLPAFACKTTPTGISNDALGSVPQHPFYQLVINSLEEYNRDWGSPYVTVMASTGPLFLSLALQEYEKLRSEEGVVEPWGESPTPGRGKKEERKGNDAELGRVVVLSREEGVSGYNFFWNVEGRSWQGADERIVSWLERYWGFSIILAVGAVVGAWEGLWRIGLWGGRWVRRGLRRVARWVLERTWQVPPL